MSMQIVEKSVEGLSKVFAVTVPADDLAERFEARLSEITPQMKIKGFRPGKVPKAHVKRLHGKALMGEVIEQALSEGTQQVIDQNNLRLATQPDLRPSSDMNKVLEGGEDLAYDLAVECMPDFEPVDPATLTLKRPVYEPTEEEVTEALGELAKQSRTYEPRKGRSLKAKADDQLLIDFVGTIDGVAFEGGTAEDVELVLGSNQFIPGFEDQLIGAKADADATVTVTVNFPDDYGAEHLRSKTAEFAVKVKDVRAPVETVADDALATRLGLSDLATLTDVLKKNIGDQYVQASRAKVKRALLDQLDGAHSIELPQGMVEAEFTNIWGQIEQDRAAGTLPEDDAAKDEDTLRAEYRKIAERRVRLGLVLAEIGRRENVQVTEQELADAMRREAMRYGQQAAQIFELFRNNPQAQAQLRAPIYEDKVVDLILSKATVEDQAVSKDELMAEDDMPEGYVQ